MMDLWYVLVGILAIVAVVLFLRTRRPAAPAVGSANASDNYVQGREDTRVSGMSAEDQAWETASQERAAARQRPPGPA